MADHEHVDEQLEPIFYAFRGKLVGTFMMKVHVCEVVSQMPEDVIDYVTGHCWFLGSLDDAWAFTFTGNDLKDQHLIVVSDGLLHQHADQIHYTIAHEIGHVMLGHRNSILEHQSKEEISRQEQEAHDFAVKYVPDPEA